MIVWQITFLVVVFVVLVLLAVPFSHFIRVCSVGNQIRDDCVFGSVLHVSDDLWSETIIRYGPIRRVQSFK